MALDPRFVICPSLQEIFFDKDIGFPLAGGIVTFYADDNRSVYKPVYELSGNGTYDDSSYVALTNPLILSSIGTFVDNSGNDIVPYLFPYQGTPDMSTGDVELYYITVQSSGGVFQFTRQAWPNTIAAGSNVNQNELINYIPNGQFWLHNNNPTSTVVGNRNISYIAQGGWTFETVTPSAAINTLKFTRVPGDFGNPDVTADPRYQVEISCTSAVSSDPFKDLCIAFPDVNKFSSTTNKNNYTFSFQGYNKTGGSVSCNIYVIKNFGTGGSAPITNQLFSLTSPFNVLIPATTSGIQTISGYFGDNTASTIGPNDDDYVQVVIRFPTNQTFDVVLTDFILTPGAVPIAAFPQTPNDLFLSQSTAGWLPQPASDGSDLYLPVVLTPQGMTYDTSTIGTVVAKMTTTAAPNELYCDGTGYQVYTTSQTTGLQVSNINSVTGIPYKRLQNVLLNNNNSFNIPIFGTGSQYVNALINSGQTSQIVFSQNAVASTTVSSPANGTSSPGFTYDATLSAGQAANIGYNAHSNSIGLVTAQSIFNNGATAATIDAGGAFATGMMITQVTPFNSAVSVPSTYYWQIQAAPASSLVHPSAAGKYFQFYNNTTAYYIWFQITNETDPSGGGGGATGTGIKVILNANMLAVDVGNMIATAISGFQVNTINTIAASTIPAGSYFTFTANPASTTIYTPWYIVDSVGVQPNGITNPIPVNILSTDLAPAVASKTQLAINSEWLAVPDLRGVFLRGAGNSTIDIDVNSRWSYANSVSGASIGTFEYGQFLSHQHNAGLTGDPANSLFNEFTIQDFLASGTGQTALLNSDSPGNHQYTLGRTAPTGGTENRPINTYINYFIKY